MEFANINDPCRLPKTKINASCALRSETFRSWILYFPPGEHRHAFHISPETFSRAQGKASVRG